MDLFIGCIALERRTFTKVAQKGKHEAEDATARCGIRFLWCPGGQSWKKSKNTKKMTKMSRREPPAHAMLSFSSLIVHPSSFP
jgi:hypothetical protein